MTVGLALLTEKRQIYVIPLAFSYSNRPKTTFLDVTTASHDAGIGLADAAAEGIMRGAAGASPAIDRPPGQRERLGGSQSKRDR